MVGADLDADAAECGDRFEAVLVRFVVADEDGESTVERRPRHEALDGSRLTDPPRLDVEDASAAEDLQLVAERRQRASYPAVELFGARTGLTVVDGQADALVLDDDAGDGGYRRQQAPRRAQIDAAAK